MIPASATLPSPVDAVTVRRNGLIFFAASVLLYLSAPVRYVGVVQAALCDKLGASALVANLPATGYFLACFAPIVCASFIPHRLEKTTVVGACWGIAILSVLASVILFIPMDADIRIWVIVGQSLAIGLCNSVEQVFLMQCFGRGTTPEARAWTLKLTFTLGPVFAVIGSLGGQYVLRGAIPFLKFPQDFAALYFFGGLCSALTALACAKLSVPPIPDEPRVPFFRFLWESLQRFITLRDLRLLWIGFLLWYATLLALPNLSLYTRQAMGREPAEFSGVIMAIQFMAKASAGFFLGLLFQCRGEKAPILAVVVAAALGIIWAMWVPGYLYLAAFAFLGTAQLGGIYFPNVLLSRSPPQSLTRDLAMLNLATVAASPAPALYGWVTAQASFASSFYLALGASVVALGCVLLIPDRHRPASAPAT